MHVFVYGTLKAGHGNNVLLHDSKLVGTAHTKHEFRMFTAGGFPVVCDTDVKSISAHQVSGELYEITPDVLARLDRLEGYPTMYDRQETEVDVQDTGIYQTAWMYVGASDYWGFDRMQPCRIEGGRWTW